MLCFILRVLGKQKGEAMTTEKSHFSSRFKNSTNWLKREHAVFKTACVREAKGGGDDNGKNPILALGSKILRIDWKENMLCVILRVLEKQKGEALTTEKSQFSSRFKNSTNWLKREHAVFKTACVREAKGGGDDNGKNPILALGSKILRIDWKENMLCVILRVLEKQKGEALTTEKSQFSSRFKNSTNWLKREHAVFNTACVREAKGGGDDNGKIPF